MNSDPSTAMGRPGAARPRVRLDFCDFHPGFDKTNNFLYRVLAERFDVCLCDQPDFLIYDQFGDQHKLHTGVRIFFTGESTAPDYSVCDYSITCRDWEDPRHCRLPYYVTYGGPEPLIKAGERPEEILAAKTRFCAFVVSNHNRRKNRNRLEFFEKLSRYKKVDSGGRFRNNIGGPIPGWSAGKLNFLRAYKFNIAFENGAFPGYTTEKIYEAMRARCLPIYSGDPAVARDFNPRSFLNQADYPSAEALIEKVIELDRDDGKYLEYARQPFFHQDTPNEFFDPRRLLDFFERVFSTPITPNGQRKRFFRLGRWLMTRKNRRHAVVFVDGPGAAS